MVHMNNGILLSHKKEWIWVSTNEMDEPRANHTEWSMSERENQILYIKAYTWSLERLYWWTYLQGSNGDADREQTHRPGEREMERVGPVERAPWKHRHCHLWNRQLGRICCMTQGTQTRLWDNLEGWEVGGRLTRAGTYVYLWLSQWYVRNLYNIVKQSSFKKNFKNCEKKKIMSVLLPATAMMKSLLYLLQVLLWMRKQAQLFTWKFSVPRLPFLSQDSYVSWVYQSWAPLRANEVQSLQWRGE